jgi:hypothetical protein
VNRYPGYTFQAKVYDVGSVFGIEQGRISKLQVWRDDRTVMHYDSGWDESPATRRDRKVLREILAGFPDQRREQVKDDVAAARREPRRGFALSWSRARADDDFERRLCPEFFLP